MLSTSDLVQILHLTSLIFGIEYQVYNLNNLKMTVTFMLKYLKNHNI